MDVDDLPDPTTSASAETPTLKLQVGNHRVEETTGPSIAIAGETLCRNPRTRVAARGIPFSGNVDRPQAVSESTNPIALQDLDPEGLSSFESRMVSVREINAHRASPNRDVRL